jgi:hypothetical protein
MRFDILDEYSTLLLFGLGVFKQNKAVEYPATAAPKAVKPSAMANCASYLKILLQFVKALGRTAAVMMPCLTCIWSGSASRIDTLAPRI